MKSAQDKQDAEIASRKKMPKGGISTLLHEQEPTKPSPSVGSYDPIENAMRRHPGLTREQAEKMAEDYGF